VGEEAVKTGRPDQIWVLRTGKTFTISDTEHNVPQAMAGIVSSSFLQMTKWRDLKDVDTSDVPTIVRNTMPYWSGRSTQWNIWTLTALAPSSPRERKALSFREPLENLGHTAIALDNKCTHVLNMREFCSCSSRFCILTGFHWLECSWRSLMNIETSRLPESKVSLERHVVKFLGRF